MAMELAAEFDQVNCIGCPYHTPTGRWRALVMCEGPHLGRPRGAATAQEAAPQKAARRVAAARPGGTSGVANSWLGRVMSL